MIVFRRMRQMFVRCAMPICLLATAGVAGAAPQPPVPSRADRAPEFRLSGDRVVLAVVMAGPFPFVEADIQGVHGKLMFDTGEDEALALNDHRIAIADARAIGTGHFGSGESFPIRLAPVVRDVHVGSLDFARVTQVQTQNATQLEHITPDFLGWLGYYGWQGYAMKLDYVRSQVTFYKGPPKDYLAGEKLLGIIAFTLGKLPNQPMVRVRLGGVEVTGVFDTGQYGSFFTDDATKARLLASGAMKAGADGSFDLPGLTIGDQHFPGVKGMEVRTVPFPAAANLGTTTRSVMGFGYGFLSQYKTVWDYRTKQIYLLAR